MALDCGGKCMKYILFAFNFLFLVASILLLALSVWMYVSPSVKDDISEYSMKTTIIFLMVLSAVMLLVSFLGCCGACRESSCMLGSYAGLLILIILAQVVAFILALVFQGKLGAAMETGMKKEVEEEVKREYDIDATTLRWHNTEIRLKCCGYSGYKDYRKNPNFNTIYPLPLSCCKKIDWDETPGTVATQACYNAARMDISTSSNYIYLKGCYGEIKSDLKSNSIIIISVLAAIVLLEIFGVVFACCVRSQTKNTSYE